MSGSDDNWLLEGFIGFLKGPIWTTPIQQFLEQNCYVFGTSESEEHEEDVLTECKQIHKMYKELVDSLLVSFLKDIGCSHEQFVKTCDRSRLSKHPIYLELLEQIWATENFDLFKSLMIRKNVELELQALVLLQCQLGLFTDMIENEDHILSIVIQRSKDEYERRSILVTNEDFKIARDIADSKEATKALQKDFEQQDDINKRLLEMKLNSGNNDKKIELSRPASSKPKQKEVVKHDFAELPPLVSQNRIPSAKSKPIVNVSGFCQEIPRTVEVPFNTAQEYLIQTDENKSENELERRSDFMRKQRELLLERKRIEREKQLQNYVKESEKHEPRPMSSRTAKASLDGVEPKKTNPEEEKERKKLEARRALAEILRKEVINSSSKK